MARSARGLPGLLALALLALALPTLAAAQTAAGAQVPPDSIVKPDPPGVWRIFEPMNEGSTSKCIGKLSTPICAIETAMVCFRRSDAALCRIALADGRSEPLSSPYPYDTYRFVGSAKVGGKGWWRVVERRFGGHYRSILPEAKPGDVAVFVALLDCRTRRGCLSRERNRPPDLFAVRRIRGLWKVVDYTSPVF